MRRSLAKLLMTLMLVSGSATLLMACNTTEGIGEDMSATGDAISDSADENKGY